MRVHSLTLSAFGPFADTVSVDLDDVGRDGLFLLWGPTGAGKTSLLDAVVFALYGSVPGARGQEKRLRSDHASAEVRTEVRCEVTLGGERLRITRRPEQVRPKKRGTGTTTEQALLHVQRLTDGGGSRSAPASTRAPSTCAPAWVCRPSSSARWCCCRRATSPGSCGPSPRTAAVSCAPSSTSTASPGPRSGWPTSAGQRGNAATPPEPPWPACWPGSRRRHRSASPRNSSTTRLTPPSSGGCARPRRRHGCAASTPAPRRHSPHERRKRPRPPGTPAAHRPSGTPDATVRDPTSRPSQDGSRTSPWPATGSTGRGGPSPCGKPSRLPVGRPRLPPPPTQHWHGPTAHGGGSRLVVEPTPALHANCGPLRPWRRACWPTSSAPALCTSGRVAPGPRGLAGGGGGRRSPTRSVVPRPAGRARGTGHGQRGRRRSAARGRGRVRAVGGAVGRGPGAAAAHRACREGPAHVLELREAVVEAREHVQELRDARLDGMAAELAVALAEAPTARCAAPASTPARPPRRAVA